MSDSPAPFDFGFPAAPGANWPAIMGDPEEETIGDVASDISGHVVHAFNDNTSSLFAVSSTSELTILSTEIPAGQMGEGDVYSWRITAEMFNDTGSPVTFRLRFYFDGAVKLDTGARSINASAQEYKMWLQIDMASVINPSSPGGMKISGMALGTATGASDSWAGLGTTESSIGFSTATASPSSAIPLDFSVQMGTASVNAYFDVSPGWHLLRFPRKHLD